MKKFIITISREFGCNAREVARKAAAELGVEFYDKDLVDMAAERAGISRDSFLDSEEMLDKNADRLLKSFGYGSSTQFYSDKAVKAQVDIIRDLANKRVSAIFFGRCADYALADEPHCLNIFIRSNMDDRIKRISERLNVPENKAKDIIKKKDKERSSYYNYYTSKKWGDARSYDLCLNTSQISVEDSIELILKYRECMRNHNK